MGGGGLARYEHYHRFTELPKLQIFHFSTEWKILKTWSIVSTADNSSDGIAWNDERSFGGLSRDLWSTFKLNNLSSRVTLKTKFRMIEIYFLRIPQAVQFGYNSIPSIGKFTTYFFFI
jgi:hypothetical protein